MFVVHSLLFVVLYDNATYPTLIGSNIMTRDDVLGK